MSLLGFRSYKRARWLKFLTQKYRLVLMEKFLLNMFQRNQILMDDPCFFDRTCIFILVEIFFVQCEFCGYMQLIFHLNSNHEHMRYSHMNCSLMHR